MVDKKSLRQLFSVLLVCGWATTAAAAVIASPDSLAGLPWVEIGIGGVLSLWGGFARTAQRALDARVRCSDFHLWFELAKDVVVSGLIGFVVFGMSAIQSWSVWFLAVALPLAGYSGARYLETLSTKIADKISGLGGPST